MLLPKLPFYPSTVEENKARYSKALLNVFDGEAIAIGTQTMPSETAANVFHFKTGHMLIISRESNLEGRWLHLTASVVPNTDLYYSICRGKLSVHKFLEDILDLFEQISGIKMTQVNFIGILLPERAPYWRMKDPYLETKVESNTPAETNSGAKEDPGAAGSSESAATCEGHSTIREVHLVSPEGSTEATTGAAISAGSSDRQVDSSSGQAQDADGRSEQGKAHTALDQHTD